MADNEETADNEEMPVAVDDEEEKKPAVKNDGDDEKGGSGPVKLKRIPRPWPGDGELEKDPECIEFKWDKNTTERKDCDTLHMLFLLQLALKRVRARTNERNKYFKSIGRKDRYISHLDNPQIITNFLVWHNKDKNNNLFDGNLFDSADKLTIIEQYIHKHGGVKMGPATKIYTKLTKDIILQTTEWLDTPQPILKLQTWGWTKLYQNEKILEECTTEELVILLTYYNPDAVDGDDGDGDEKKGDDGDDAPKVIKGVFQSFTASFVKKGKVSTLETLHKVDGGVSEQDPAGVNQKCVAKWKELYPDKNVEDYWKDRVIAFIRGQDRIMPDDYTDPVPPDDPKKKAEYECGGGPYTGKMLDGKGKDVVPTKQLTNRLMNYLVPIGAQKANKKPSNTILRGPVSTLWRELKKCYVYEILDAAAKQKK